MTCRLCLRDEPLRNSHIIPEFFYGRLYDETHRFFSVSSDPEKKDLTHQKGAREKMLCDSCEGRFARNEKYFSELFFGGVIAEYADDGRHLLMRRIDYAKIKLMFISILWRMSVSKLPFFGGVDLGPHEEITRAMLLAEDPGSEEAYGVMAIAPYFEGTHLGHFITPPDVVRIHANRIYRCVMGGVLFFFYVPGRQIPSEIMPFFPSLKGTWRIRRERIEDIDFLFHYALEIGRGIDGRAS